MFPLWDRVIAPVLEASGAQRLVEIGALKGETTVRLLEVLGPGSEAHVIDPTPQFDPSEHQAQVPGRYHFHRDLSHNVLPTLPPVDVALVDGDHNWYTVYNELEMLAATAKSAGAPLPLLVMHDVGWPYGRRDLYYDPERIPEEYRHPYAKLGLRRGRRDVLERGGINSRMNNALREGGPRNGVMTALEDFLEQYEGEVRVVVLPVYFGLAFVASAERLQSRPELGEALDRLRRPHFLRGLLDLSERLRTKEMQWGQTIFYSLQDKVDRGARRYLDLVRAGLDGDRLEHLENCLETIRVERVKGDLVDWGRPGSSAALMRGFIEAHELDEAELWAAGPEPALAAAREGLERLELLDERVHLLAAEPTGALAETPIERVALLRIGAGPDPGEVLEALYDRLSFGSFVIVEDGAAPDRRAAVDRFRAERGIGEPLVTREADTVWWRRD